MNKNDISDIIAFEGEPGTIYAFQITKEGNYVGNRFIRKDGTLVKKPLVIPETLSSPWPVTYKGPFKLLNPEKVVAGETAILDPMSAGYAYTPKGECVPIWDIPVGVKVGATYYPVVLGPNPQRLIN